ncbi:MAG TPA: YdhR family protein [Chloroflexaceae bacterium]|nr:YdhR family protein [Chloroflexaceae bacterium]
MAQKLLQVNGRLLVTAEEFEQHCRPEDAQEFASVPGLLWKIWIVDRDRGEAGGIYLFADEAAYQAYLHGPLGSSLTTLPLWTAVSLKGFDYLPGASAVTRAPVGAAYAAANGAPLTFTGMAERAAQAVPSITPAELERRLTGEPDLLVIDVRDAADIAQTGTIPGAVNISYGALTYQADHTLPQEWQSPLLADCARPIVTTCILGPLGVISGGLLHEMGFHNVQALEGGVQAWKDAGLPVTSNGH